MADGDDDEALSLLDKPAANGIGAVGTSAATGVVVVGEGGVRVLRPDEAPEGGS